MGGNENLYPAELFCDDTASLQCWSVTVGKSAGRIFIILVSNLFYLTAVFPCKKQCIGSGTGVTFCSAAVSRVYRDAWTTRRLAADTGASGDTELFEKASNINGFQGGRVANNLYISPFWATVFQTAAFFLYPNSSVVIRVENLCFLSPWLAL